MKCIPLYVGKCITVCVLRDGWHDHSGRLQMVTVRFLGPLLLLLAACGGADTKDVFGQKVCVAATTIECACPGGAKGAQSCRDDGTGYEACQCASGSGGAAGSGGAGGATTGGSGGSSGAGQSGSGGAG